MEQVTRIMRRNIGFQFRDIYVDDVYHDLDFLYFLRLDIRMSTYE